MPTASKHTLEGLSHCRTNTRYHPWCPPCQASATSSPHPLRTPLNSHGAACPGPISCRKLARCPCLRLTLLLKHPPELSQRRQGAQAGSEQCRAGTVSKAPLLPGPTSGSVLPEMKAELFRNSHVPHRDLHFTFWPLFFSLY